MIDSLDTSARAAFDGMFAEEHARDSGCSADEIVLRVRSNDGLLIGWGGTVTQKARAVVKYFARDESYWLLFVSKGILRVKVDSNTFAVPTGHSLLVLPNEMCVGAEPNRTAVQWQWLAFRVVRSRGRDRSVSVEVPRVVKVFDPARVVELFRLLIDEFHAYQRVMQPDRKLGTKSAQYLLLSLLAKLDPSEERNPLPSNAATVLAERAKDYIRTNLSNPITTSTIASALECSEGYLGVAFRKTYAETPSDYILRTRISIAKELLFQTRQSINQIARECGFTSSNYFARAFKRHSGMTPSEYRIAHSHHYITTDI